MNPWRSAKKLSIVCLRPTIRLAHMAGIAMVANELRGLETIFDMMMVMVIYHSIQGV